MSCFTVSHGDSPIILAQPHGGTFVPDTIVSRLNQRGQALADTDWHIARLYAGLLVGATIVQSKVHRYVIDANRDPQGGSLYPGQNTTSLCPTTDFNGQDIWQDGQAPSADEIDNRRHLYHAPYHAALAEEIARVRARHGVAIVYDCHSIRSQIPFLFQGTLPTFSIGTHSGSACALTLERLVQDACPAQDSVVNGRFKGGWTTRHYGQPETGVHAIQMELTQCAYMHEAAPWKYAPKRAAVLRPVLGNILQKLTQGAAHVQA